MRLSKPAEQQIKVCFDEGPKRDSKRLGHRCLTGDKGRYPTTELYGARYRNDSLGSLAPPWPSAAPFPVYPDQRTFLWFVGMCQTCHKGTSHEVPILALSFF
jgi:hypothetical protein